MKRFSLHLILAFAACAAGMEARVVDNPHVSYATSNTITLERVELTDSVTTLHFNAHFRPGWWIRLDDLTFLRADGKEYGIIATEGLKLNEKLFMHDNGEHGFSVSFEPLPIDTERFDFIEMDESFQSAFHLFDVDLTGTVDPYADPGWPKYPQEDLSIPEWTATDSVAVINVHMLRWKPNLMKHVALMNSNEAMEGEILPDGSATLRLPLCFPQRVWVSSGSAAYFGSFLTAPGDTVELYLDAMAGGDIYRGYPFPPQRLRAIGKFTGVDLYTGSDKLYYDNRFRLLMSAFRDYRQSGAQLLDKLIDAYHEGHDIIDRSGLGDLQKRLSRANLDFNILLSARNYRQLMAAEYQNQHLGRSLPPDSIATYVDSTQYARLAKLIAVDNPDFYFFDSGNTDIYRFHNPDAELSYSDRPQTTDESEPIFQLLRIVPSRLEIVAYTSAQIDSVKASTPYMEKVFEADVPADSVIESIAARHPGKFVLFQLSKSPSLPIVNEMRGHEDNVVYVLLTDITRDDPESAEAFGLFNQAPNAEVIIISTDRLQAIFDKYACYRDYMFILSDPAGKVTFEEQVGELNYIMLKINKLINKQKQL